MQINIIYWSGSGNTEAMAKFIQEGAQSKGATVNLKYVSEASVDDVNCDVLALGCPSMGDEVLEEGEFEPYMESIENSVGGKKVVLFGSYGWGDGQWMREWEERMKNAGAVLIAESLIVNEAPDGPECTEFGAKITE